MAQPVFADAVILPPNSTGTKVPMFAQAITGGTVYAPGQVITDRSTGDAIDSAIASLAGTERGIVTHSMIQGTAFTIQTPTALTATGQSATLTTLDAVGNLQVTVKGTYGFTTTPPTYIWEGSDDSGTNWYPITVVREDCNFGEQTGTLAANMLRTWSVAIAGFNQVRMRLTAWGTPTGSIVVRAEPGGFLFEPAASTVPSAKVMLVFSADAVTPAVTNTLVTLTAYRDGTSGGTGTSFTPAAGKKWRITTFTATWRNTTAAINSATGFLRQNVGSAATIATSPLIAAATGAANAATIGVGSTGFAVFPEGGIEIGFGQTIGVSAIASLAGAGFYATVSGYEY